MPYFWVIVYLACVCGVFLFAWIGTLMVHDHEPRGELDPVVWMATLAPLPAPAEPWRPRAVPDVPVPAPAVSVALSAVRHPCYQYAARLAAMSWQSHKTLQRSYDMLAFATVAQAYYRRGVSYA